MGDHEEVMTMELRMIPVDRIRIREGHNARADVGDVAELAESIRANGVLQALTVEELPDGDVFALVAGERRLTAARLAEIAEVPCVVRRGLDERARTAAMLVENLQREDLSPLEEAAGIQRLVELGLSQREIAHQLGRSQGQVSKRLTLLELPDDIRSAIGGPSDSGGISVAEALELAKLTGQPERQTEAFNRGRTGFYGGVTGMVRHHLQELENERRRAAARAELQRAGVKILKEEPYYSWYGRREKPLLGGDRDQVIAIRMTVEEHQGEPCHAAAIDGEGKVTHVCTDPARHPDADPGAKASERIQRDQQRQRAEDKRRREAARGRLAVMTRVLAGTNSSRLAFAAHQVLASWRLSESKQACSLLGIEVPKSTGYGSADYSCALADYAGASMAAAQRALLALALATGEERVAGDWGDGSGICRRHLELLKAAGYEPNSTDRKYLNGEEASR